MRERRDAQTLRASSAILEDACFEPDLRSQADYF
jgi:hypothetical protein